MRGSGLRQGSSVLVMVCGCMASGRAADPLSLKLFDLPQPQLRSTASERPAGSTSPATNGFAPVEELALQLKAGSDINLLVQRHETMNGRSLLSPRPLPRETSNFQRTLDWFLPSKGAFLQKNPNVLSSPLRMSEYWAK